MFCRRQIRSDFLVFCDISPQN
ncbi:hypothetical protein AKJ16_DCAP13888 [Drosera capensis]